MPQVQSLVYIHDWKTDKEKEMGGEFVMYPKGADYEAVPVGVGTGTAVFCDGSETIHGTATFKL